MWLLQSRCKSHFDQNNNYVPIIPKSNVYTLFEHNSQFFYSPIVLKHNLPRPTCDYIMYCNSSTCFTYAEDMVNKVTPRVVTLTWMWAAATHIILCMRTNLKGGEISLPLDHNYVKESLMTYLNS